MDFEQQAADLARETSDGRRVINNNKSYSKEPEFFFSEWFLRLVMFFGALVIAGFIAIFVIQSELNQNLDQLERAVQVNSEQTAGITDAAFKNRATQCEILATLKAPLPPSCLEPGVIRYLPAEMQNAAPFNGQPVQ